MTILWPPKVGLQTRASAPGFTHPCPRTVNVVEDAGASYKGADPTASQGFHLMLGMTFAVIKHYNQKQLGGGRLRVYFILHFHVTVPHGGVGI